METISTAFDLDAVAQALKPGGKLVIEVHNAAAMTAMWHFHNDPYIQLASASVQR